LTGKNKRIRPAGRVQNSGERSGVDVAGAVKEMISAQYPGMNEDDAMRLAVMLTKAQFKGEI
jgi:hypothetical protein